MFGWSPREDAQPSPGLVPSPELARLFLPTVPSSLMGDRSPVQTLPETMKSNMGDDHHPLQTGGELHFHEDFMEYSR